MVRSTTGHEDNGLVKKTVGSFPRKKSKLILSSRFQEIENENGVLPIVRILIILRSIFNQIQFKF